MRARQNTWASSALPQINTTSSIGRSSSSSSSSSNSQKRLHRRSTYPLAGSYTDPPALSPSTATLLDTPTTANTSDTSPFYYLAGCAATISSATTATQQSTPPAVFLSKSYIPMTPPLSLRPITAPPVFHAQSLLFMFGFLFFPCWWIGGFYLGDPVEKTKNEGHHVIKPGSSSRHRRHHRCRCRRCRQTLVSAATPVAVHPSMLANGRATSRVIFVHPPVVCVAGEGREEEEQQPEAVAAAIWAQREQAMFRQWNRWLSFASVVMVAFIIAMLAWYHVGVRDNRWPSVFD